MFNNIYKTLFTMIFILCFLSCDNSTEPTKEEEESPQYPELVEVASSGYLWTGVAVSNEGRIFVCFPRWSRPIQMSVAELVGTTMTAHPYPNEEWNNWYGGVTAFDHFVCVQSVYIDNENYLWILDTGNPQLEGVIERGAKLIKIDLSTNTIIDLFELGFSDTDTYLNDVRIDNTKDYAYITDSGVGAICVVDILSGDKRVLLFLDASTKAEDIILNIEGIPYSRTVHSDGLAIDPAGEYLYYQALRARNLYRINTRWLSIRDTVLKEAELKDKVEHVIQSGASDGIEFGPDGNLYLTSIEENAIKRYTVSGTLETVIADSRIKWPDSFSITSDTTIYFTISQVHRISNPSGLFMLYKIRPYD